MSLEAKISRNLIQKNKNKNVSSKRQYNKKNKIKFARMNYHILEISLDTNNK